MSGINNIKSFFVKVKDKVADKEFRADVVSRINPAPLEGSDYLVDYILRVLIFLFPLFIIDNTAVVGISDKDILFGVVILVMSMYCVVKLFRSGMVNAGKVGLPTLVFLAVFVLILVAFAFQFTGLSKEIPHTYLYIGCFLLPFCVRFVGDFRKYFMQLFSAASVIVYISMYSYIFSGAATLIGVEKLLSRPAQLTPFLMLGIAINALLYLTEDNDKKQKVYLIITASASVLLFLYGDMAAFIMILLYIMGLQFINLPTVSFMKKNMILLFLYGFCASNAPLLTYFNAKGISKEFDLEYSIYIDIAIAVAGLIITSYWEKIPKERDEDHTLMSGFSRWYRRSIFVVLVLLILAFVFGSRGAKLKNAIGGKALSGFSTALWKSISKSSGELWHVLSVYGVIGVILMLLIGSILLRYALRVMRDGKSTSYEKGLMLITILFVIQTFFYSYSSASTPEYLIFVGFALCAKALKSQSDLQYVAEADYSQQEPESAGTRDGGITGKIWIPGYVRNELEKEKELAKEIVRKESEDNGSVEGEKTGWRRFMDREKLSKYVPRVVFLSCSALAAGLALLVVFSLYRLFMPIGNKGNTESMVENAIALRDERLLAQAELEAAQNGLLVQEAASTEISADAAIELTSASSAATSVSISAAESSIEPVVPIVPTDFDEETVGSEEEETEEAVTDASKEEDTEEAATEASNEEEPEGDAAIEKGISHGDYSIYDPNADYLRKDDMVTGRNGSVNLRSIPRTDGDSVVIHALGPAETIRRIAVGRNGWSKVVYNRQVLYAVTEYLEPVKADAQEPEEEEAQEEDEGAAEEEEQDAAAEEPVEEATSQAPADEAAAATSKETEKPKTYSAYSMQWGTDNKSCSIWSSGQKLGTLTVTDEEGNSKSMTYFGTHYQGTGRNQKNYLYIYVPQGDGSLSVNADPGFVDALKNMGYSGLYFNKSVVNW